MRRPPVRAPLPLALLLGGCAVASSGGYAPSGSYAQQSQYRGPTQPVQATGSTAQSQSVPSQTYPAATTREAPEQQNEPTVDGDAQPQPRMSVSSGVSYDIRPTAPAAPPRAPAATFNTTPAPTPVAPSGNAPREQIARWESLLNRDRNALLAGLTACRDICAAASNICVAAREICRLSGNDPAEDHCARAHSACAEAGQRRDAACAVCP